MKKLVWFILAIAIGAQAQTQVNPATQIRWPAVTGSGAPSSGCPVITTGTAPAINAVVATITLANACPTGTVPAIQPSNIGAASLSGGSKPYATNASSTQWIIQSNGTALGASTTYSWGFQVRCY